MDGPRSVPADIDGHHTLFGGVQAARRTARTIFLGSAPSTQAEMIRGVQTERILLGSVQPEQTIGVFEDVLKRLRDRLHYLYAEQDRYWLDTKPNLRREMESRKQNISERDDVIPLLKDRVGQFFRGQNHQFAGIHVFTPSVDVPDDYGNGPRLVVLPLDAGYSHTETNQAYGQAEKILRNRGEQPRQKQNRLIFLAPDFDVVGRLKEQTRIYLAWRSIVTDIDNGTLNQDLSHLKQSERSRDAAGQSLGQLIRETWKWLMAPIETFVRGRPELRWEVVNVPPTAPYLIRSIEDKLREEDWVVYEWSPIHLRKVLSDWYLKDDVREVSALKVWQDSCHYLYLPRLVNDQVFRNAIAQGVETEDYFGFASGKEGDRYLGFAFGNGSLAALDESSLLIERETAAAYAEKLRATQQSTPTSTESPGYGGQQPSQTGGTGVSEISQGDPTVSPGGTATSQAGVTSTAKSHFYGTVELDAVKAKMDFATIMDEVVQQFTAQLGVDVTISVEIEARKSDGFDESLQRTIKENCNVLKFSSSEFEED